ncbi:MAG: nitroreductase family protein [Bryobacterales bacterium]|nr:nitroreductase family protein [Bryobacteraceae bacterium]MDW8130718.1 nitroreductase family protein [Bryobacterales bacterium]
MEFFDLIRARRSVRAYAPRPVEEDKVQQILTAANLAPSAGNLQAYEIYLVRDRQVRVELARASLDQWFVSEAPVALVFCAHPERSASKYGRRGARLYALQDATIACTFAMLAATELGLASVWVGAFDDEGVRRAIRAPEGHQPVAILPIGYPAEHPAPAPRRSLADLVHEI